MGSIGIDDFLIENNPKKNKKNKQNGTCCSFEFILSRELSSGDSSLRALSLSRCSLSVNIASRAYACVLCFDIPMRVPAAQFLFFPRFIRPFLTSYMRLCCTHGTFPLHTLDAATSVLMTGASEEKRKKKTVHTNL